MRGTRASPQSRAREPAQVIWASTASDVVADIRPAAGLVGDLVREAESALPQINYTG